MAILSKNRPYFHELFWEKMVENNIAYYYNESR